MAVHTYFADSHPDNLQSTESTAMYSKNVCGVTRIFLCAVVGMYRQNGVAQSAAVATRAAVQTMKQHPEAVA